MNSLYIQSGEEQESKSEEHEIVSFTNDEHTKIEYAAIYDSVVSDIFTQNYELGEFLRRPTKLAHYTVTPGAPFAAATVYPWHAFCDNAKIKKKLDNYAYMQATMKIKVIVNSTPFIFGRIGLSYQPLYEFTPISNDSNNYLCLSQRPTAWLDLASSTGGEMTLPFFYYKNWLQITDADELQKMGRVDIWQLVQAAIANAGITSTPSFTIYGWLEDVRLYGNTISLAVQSGEDDYPDGPVSSVATTVANIASTLSDIPIIGRFAKATSIGARAISSIASMFGFTNVPVVSDATPFKSMPFHGLASSEISNVVDKLTVDPKNELCIAPSTVGLPNTDELAIGNLVTHRAILTKQSWATTSATDTLLFAANITPTLSQTSVGTNQYLVKDTPLGMVARCFSNWRGDICIKVEVVKSPYHKGRLVINYDPVGDIITTADNNNVVMTHIMDISESSSVVFRIPYMAPQNFLRVRELATSDYAVGGATPATYDPDYHNGRFTVRVLNNLTAPLDTAAVTLLFSVYGCDNTEFSNPSDPQVYLGTSTYHPSIWSIQSGEEEVIEEEEITLGKSTQVNSKLYDISMGERILSMRTLLRRSNFVGYESFVVPVSTTVESSAKYSLTLPKYPQTYGYHSGGIHGAQEVNGAGADVNFNFVNSTTYAWLAACFVAQRGSMIWHFNSIDSKPVKSMRVRRITETKTVTTRATLRSIVTDLFGGTYSASARNSLTSSGAAFSGISVINQHTQSGLSVLMPQYNKFRFVTANPANATYGSAVDDTINEKFVLEITVDANPTTTSNSGFERYASIGTDFNFFFFLNVPPRYFYIAPPAAATF